MCAKYDGRVAMCCVYDGHVAMCHVSCVLQTQLVNAAENINSQLSYFNELDRISTVSLYVILSV